MGPMSELVVMSLGSPSLIARSLEDRWFANEGDRQWALIRVHAVVGATGAHRTT